jgi:EpsI family protein
MVFREKKVIVFVGCVLAVFLATTLAKMPSQAERKGVYAFPAAVGAWQASDLPIYKEMFTLGTKHMVFRQYRNSGNGAVVTVYIAYYPDLESSDLAHAPEVCYPGQGWEILSNDEKRLALSTGVGIPVKRMVIEKGGEQEVVYSWWQTQGRILASNSWYHLYQIMNRIAFKDTSSIWVRISARAGIESSKPQAERTVQEFCDAAAPLMSNFFQEGRPQ